MTNPVVTIDADANMSEVLDTMTREEVGSLVVTTGTPPHKVGIVTDTDVKTALKDVENPVADASIYERLLFLLHQPETGSPVREYMSAPLVTVPCETTLSAAIETMNEHEIKHLIVTKHMELEGILTPSDVGRAHDDIVNEARRSSTRRPHWEK